MQTTNSFLSLIGVAISLSAFLVMGCASKDSTADVPPWAKQASRIVDNGYIVYVGSAADRDSERAQFKAEGIALEDLANECSVVPQGTRIEDRFVSVAANTQNAYVKIGVEFTGCEESKKAVDPETIRRVASVAFTQQLKKYQDFAETGEVLAKSESTEMATPEEIMSAPERRQGDSEAVHFYVTRQYIAYQKEVVILSPSTSYAPQSPEAQRFATAIVPSTQQVQALAQANPQLGKTPSRWSQILDRPRVQRPGALTKQITQQIEKNRAGRSVKSPAPVALHGNATAKPKHDAAPAKRKSGRRHR